jgi:hypothetical protein
LQEFAEGRAIDPNETFFTFAFSLMTLLLCCLGLFFLGQSNAAVCEFARPFLQQPNAISRDARVLLVWRVAKALFAMPIGDFLV